MDINSVQEQLQSQFLGQGMILMLFGGILAYLRAVPAQLYYFIKSKLIVTVTLEHNSKEFRWVEKWAADNLKESWMNRSFIGCFIQKKIANKLVFVPRFAPAPGMRLFFHEGHLINLFRQRNSQEQVGTFNPSGFTETIILTSFKLSYLAKFIAACGEAYNTTSDEYLIVYAHSSDGSWSGKSLMGRDLDTVIIDSAIKQSVTDDLLQFTQCRKWYEERGLNYTRGFLLYGPPGTGKTSLIKALATKFQAALYVFNLASLGESGFLKAMNDVQEGSIILFEDIDAVFHGRDNKLEDSVSFSTFINAIDGVSTPPGVVKIFTANHVSALDSALLRPGRCDKQYELSYATDSMAKEFFLKFFPGEEQKSEEFVTSYGGCKYPMAMLQEHLLGNRDDAEKAAQPSNLVRLETSTGFMPGSSSGQILKTLSGPADFITLPQVTVEHIEAMNKSELC